MKIVIALGGNALLRRGEPLSAENQLASIKRAAAQIATVSEGNSLVITHGNGPQVGLLALQSAAYSAVQPYPLDVLGAQTEGMIGYLLEQELSNLLGSRTVATLLTRVQVNLADPAFASPSKPIGPIYTAAEAERIGREQAWTMAADGKSFRRVVASPVPERVLGLQAIEWLLAQGAVVIAAGGGGIPVALGIDGASLHGVEAVIDKDSCSSLLARDLDAELLIIATDVDAVYTDYGLSTQRALGQTTPKLLQQAQFAAGSMGPKVAAACAFSARAGRRAVIGSLDQIEAMVRGTAGTQVSA
ncbi:MAG: carbamate kinase [Rhizobacter sp.]